MLRFWADFYLKIGPNEIWVSVFQCTNVRPGIDLDSILKAIFKAFILLFGFSIANECYDCYYKGNDPENNCLTAKDLSGTGFNLRFFI